jgi:citrate synthase
LRSGERSASTRSAVRSTARAISKRAAVSPVTDSSLSAPSKTAAALFALGRTAGWIAHIFEQQEQGFLLRPRAHYVGVRPLPQ